MKQFIKTILLLACISCATVLHSQIAGSFSVPGSFPTLAAALNTLNLTGVAGPVTINIAAGYTETAPAGGFQLITPSGNSSSNYIIFQKNGSGANPLLTAHVGTATPASAIQDGIWRIVGADYITF